MPNRVGRAGWLLLAIGLAWPLHADAGQAKATPAAQAPRSAPALPAKPAPQPSAGPAHPPDAPAPTTPGAQEVPLAAAAEASQAPAAEVYSYRPEGRRDPFVSLLTLRGLEAKPKRGEGLASITIGEVSLRGILQSRGAYLALLQGPDNKTYIAHPSDRLADGTIRAITADTIILLQEVNDPLSLTKQREVRKTIRVLEEVK